MTTLLAVLLVALFAIVIPSAEAATPSKPNILLIFMEDMGPHIGAYGDHTAHTPALDRLAGEGCTFTHGAFVTAASCAPSRASLFTGLYAHQNGVFGFVHTDGFYLRPGMPNFVKALRQAGYRTGITYKTGIDPEDDLGFEESYAPTANRLLRRKSEHEVSNCIDNIRYFLQNQPTDRPFYLQAQTSDTHSPWDRVDRLNSIRPDSPGWPYPEVHLAKIQPGGHLGTGFVFDDVTRELLRGYYRAVQRADYFVGAVLEALKEGGHEDDTLVIFSSDHGPSHMLRGKGYPYEIGLRVPFIVRWPGIVKPGARSETLVSLIDVMPTFLEAAALPAMPHLPGKSLIPHLRDGTPHREHVFSAYNAHTTGVFWPNRTVRDARWKLIHNLPTPLARERFKAGLTARSHYLQAAESLPPTAPFHNILKATNHPPEWELFDLQNDPGETHNLASDPAHADTLQRLAATLHRWQKDTVADPFLDEAFVTRFCDRYATNEKLFESETSRTEKKKLNAKHWKLDFSEFIQPWKPDTIRPKE